MRENWDDIREKVHALEGDPWLDPDMLKTMDSLAIADYWRKRFQEEKSSRGQVQFENESERQGSHELIEKLREQVQGLEKKGEILSGELKDKTNYLEERVRFLELEKENLLEKMNWEVDRRVLEDQNQFYREQEVKRRRLGWDESRRGGDPLDGYRLRDEISRLSEALEKAKKKTEEIPLLREWLKTKGEELEKFKASLQEAGPSLAERQLAAEVERMGANLLRREAHGRKMLEDFSKGFARRVKNELSVMIGTLQLCLTESPAGQQELQERIQGACVNAKTILKFIEDFMELTRAMVVKFKPLSLNGFVSRALENQEKRIRECHVVVEKSLDDRLPPFMGDGRFLGQALNVVLDNSLEAMAGGGHLRVETVLLPETREAQVKIGDTGRGIAKNISDKVFQPHFSTKKGHSGLGLTLCQKAMDLHGGEVRIFSVSGEGTTVSLIFPLGRPL